MQFRTGRRRSITALLAAAGLVAGSGVAAAQIAPMALPGTNDDAIQIALEQNPSVQQAENSARLGTLNPSSHLWQGTSHSQQG